ncbi:MAG: phosphatidylglycerophosphatase A [Burkholderiales bacterium]
MKFIFASPARFIAFGFGSGLSPKAPGTVGSLVGVGLYLLLKVFLSRSAVLGLLILLFMLGVWACERTGRDLGVADHGGMVWDEIVAMMLVLSFTPFGIVWYAVALALFRLFDIWKPFPIRLLEKRFKCGFGVMIDDIMAAIYAIVVIWITIRLFNFPHRGYIISI